jgi:hypothetical protein
VIVKRKSPFSGQINTMDLPITMEQIQRWQGGELIQNAMPNLNADEREFLISGITAEEWKQTFGPK